MFSCNILALITALLTSAHAVDLPNSVAFNQTLQFPDGLQIEMTSAIVNEGDDEQWISHFEKQLSNDIQKNPNLITHIEAQETIGREPQAKGNKAKSRVKEFAEGVTKGTKPIKFHRLAPSFWSKDWQSRRGKFYEENKSRIIATALRFSLNGVVNAIAFMVSDNPVPATAAIAGGLLIGSLSATSSWFFDFIADKIVGKAELSNRIADSWSDSRLSRWLEKFKSGREAKKNMLTASVWIEDSIRWGFVELLFLGLIKVGFVALGISEFGDVGFEIWDLLETAGLGTISQGEWEKSIFKLREKLLEEGADPKLIQKKSQYLALAGSILSVLGTVAKTFKIKVAGYAPGDVILYTLLAGGVAHRILIVKKDQLLDLGNKIMNRCSRKFESIKVKFKKNNQSSSWVISPVQCRV